MTKIRRHAVPNKATYHASTRAALLYVDLAGWMPATSMRGSNYIMIMDDYSLIRVAKFLKSKDCTTASLAS